MADVRYQQATRVYPGTTAPAVDALDLDIDDGEFMVLVGPSGSGKTTALRMLAGLEEVDAGAVLIGGRDVTGRDSARRSSANGDAAGNGGSGRAARRARGPGAHSRDREEAQA